MWPDPRHLRIGLVVAGALGSSALAYRYGVWQPAPMQAALTRPIVSLVPPWDYDTDRLRVEGLVTEALCPSGGGRPVAIRCDPVPAASPARVRAVLRDGLKRNDTGGLVTLEDVKAALETLAARARDRRQPTGWADVTIEAGALEIVADPDTSAPGLRRTLETAPVAWAANAGRVAGTGPYRMLAVKQGDPAKQMLPSSVASTLKVADAVHLQRCDGVRGCQDLYFFGTDASDSDGWVEWLDRPMPGGLALLYPADGVLNAVVSDGPSGRANEQHWYSTAQKLNRILVAVLNPTTDLGGAAAAVVASVAADGRSAAKEGFAQATCLVPPSLKPSDALCGSGPTVVPSATSGRLAVMPVSCDLVLGDRVRVLSNTSWSGPANAIASALVGAGIPTEIAVCPAAEESAARNAGRYTFSVLAVTASRSAGAWELLASNLPAWFADGPVEKCAGKGPEAVVPCAKRLNELEITGKLTANDERSTASLVRQWVFPIAYPAEQAAVSFQLNGWDSGSWTLDPDTVSVDGPASPSRWLIPVPLLVGVGGWLIAVAAGRRAEAKAQRVAEDAAGIHHDLSSPLATLRARIAAEPVSPERDRRLRDLDDALDVIDEILVVPEDGRVSAIQRQGSAAVGDIMEDVREIMGGLARERGVSVHLSIRGNGLAVTTKLGRSALRRVVGNLVRNAVAHCGGIDAQVLVLVIASGDFVTISVEDDGQGFPDHLPDPFVLGAKSKEYAGSGVGLNIVRSIVTSVGGSAYISSRRRPTRVLVSIPRLAPTPT